MKIFSLENQILAGIISSAHGYESPYLFPNAMAGHEIIFNIVPPKVWRKPYVEEAVQATYPKFWRKWIDRKSGQFRKLGEQLKRPYNRCGTDER